MLYTKKKIKITCAKLNVMGGERIRQFAVFTPSQKTLLRLIRSRKPIGPAGPER